MFFMFQRISKVEVWGVHVSTIFQMILVVLVLLLSAEQANSINLLLGVFIPMCQHYLSFGRISQPNTPPHSQPSSPVQINSDDSSPTENTNDLSLNLIHSQNSLTSSQNQDNCGFTTPNKSNNQNIDNETNTKKRSQSSSWQTINVDHAYEEQQFSRFSHRSLSWSGNRSKFFCPQSFSSKQFPSPKQSAEKSDVSVSADIKSILTYWPSYCFMYILEQQIFPLELVASHSYQIAKCSIILLLRCSSFSLYLSIRELLTIEKDTVKISLFEDPQRLNENVMKKIDEKIQVYSRCGIALARCSSPIQFKQQVRFFKSNKTPLRQHACSIIKK